MEIKDYNKIQINYNIRKDANNQIVDRSTMVNVRTETAEEALMLYSSLNEKLNGELNPDESKKQTEISYQSESETCPNCGRNLVKRKGKNGDEFMGCSGYPSCRFTKPV